MKKILLSLLTAIVMMPFAANAVTYTVAGSSNILNGDGSWAQTNVANDMTTTDNVNYTLTISGISVEAGEYKFKVVQDHDWANCWPGSDYVFKINETAKYDITYTFNAETKDVNAIATKIGEFEGSTDKTYTVAGSIALLGSEWNEKDTGNDMVKGDDGIFRLVKENVALEAKTYELKVVVNHDWGTAYPASNYKLAIEEAGNYDVTITFNESTKTVDATATAVVEVTETTVTFDFSSPSFREKVGSTMNDPAANIFNETFTANGVSLQITSGSAPTKLYTDSKKGQCLALYKEYATMTFIAPEGKAITKIEFTAAGTSNINGFTATSGTIEGMVWTGNADGVRFLQGTNSTLANAIVTLANKDAATTALPAIEYVECANIAAFNALEAGTYAKVKLTDAEVIGKSADGYSTVWIQDATGGCWSQYTSLNDRLQEKTKINGYIYTVRRVNNLNSHMKEAEATLKSEFTAEAITDYTIINGSTIGAVNTPDNFNHVIKLTGASFEATSDTNGKLTMGEEEITVNNGNASSNQLLYKVKWSKGDKMENVTIVAILIGNSNTDVTKTQLLPLSMEGVSTGIQNVTAVSTDAILFNLQGQRMNTIQKGINIVGGKKIMVK